MFLFHILTHQVEELVHVFDVIWEMEELPVAFFRRQLRGAEHSYSVTLLARPYFTEVYCKFTA